MNTSSSGSAAAPAPARIDPLGDQPQPSHGLEHEPAHRGLPPLVRLRSMLKLERNELWVAIIYSAAIGLLTLVMPVATQLLVNTIAFGNLVQPLVVLTMIVLAGMGVATILQAFRVYVVEIIQRRVFVRVSTDVVFRLLRARRDAFDQHYGPELVNRFFDVVTVQKSAAMLLIDGLSVVMQTAVGMILLGFYHPWLLAFDLILLVAIVVVLFPLGSGAVSTCIRESKAKYELAAWIQEVSRHMITFKSASGAAYALERTDALVGKYLVYRRKHFRILLRQIAGSLGLQAIASAALLGVGGWLVIQRQLTLGQLVAAELVVALVVSGFSKFGKHLELFYDLLAAIDKLGYLTDLPIEDSGAEKFQPEGRGISVRLQGMTFGYDSKAPILRDIDWTVHRGGRVGIEGHSGHGKSSLFDLIYGLQEPLSGVVQMEEIDNRELRRIDLRNQIALVRQVEVFHGTLLENVRLGDGEIGIAEVKRALASVGLLEEALALPRGLQTPLATGGLPLSHGQAVRLMFARAILRRPRLLMVDELLDHLDDARERRTLIETLFATDAPWTLIVATSNHATLKLCDQTYLLEDGKLQERGTV